MTHTATLSNDPSGCISASQQRYIGELPRVGERKRTHRREDESGGHPQQGVVSEENGAGRLCGADRFLRCPRTLPIALKRHEQPEPSGEKSKRNSQHLRFGYKGLTGQLREVVGVGRGYYEETGVSVAQESGGHSISRVDVTAVLFCCSMSLKTLILLLMSPPFL